VAKILKVLVNKGKNMKKCKKCGAPLEGFLYNTIGKLMGIKPSDKDPEMCNKCSEETASETVSQPSSEKPAMPPVAPAEPAEETPAQPAEAEPTGTTSDTEPKL
jgi:hypothetical protein